MNSQLRMLPRLLVRVASYGEQEGIEMKSMLPRLLVKLASYGR